MKKEEHSRRGFLKFLAGVGLGAVAAEVYERVYGIPSLERRFRKEVNYWIDQYNSAKKDLEELSLRLDKLDELEKESTSAISLYQQRMDEAIEGLRKTIEKYRILLGDERVSFESSTLKVLEDLKITQEKLLKVLPYFPLIKNLSFSPSKVVNDKIYDLNVSLEVISPLNTLEECEVRLVPVEYKYFIARYGMRGEDYDKVFPREEIRSVKIEPKKLEEEMFSVSFEDLKGGREYIVRARVEDVAGNEKIVEVKTPYIRQFENIAKTDDILVMASYMPWDFYKTPMKDETPFLGRYDTADDIVQWKHIDWAGGYGIDAFLIDGEYVIGGDRYSIPQKFLEKGMKIAIFFGPTREFLRKTNSNLPDWGIDLENPHNYEVFISKMKSIVSWAKYPTYLKIGDRPVVMIYDGFAFLNNSRAIRDSKNIFKEIIGKEPFIISSEIPNIPLTQQDVEYVMKYKDFSNIDAISGWAGFHNRENDMYVINYETYYKNHLDVWLKFTRDNNLRLVPSVIPGFDNSYSWGPPGLSPIERNPYKFKERLDISKGFIDGNIRAIRIDTFNDFGEWSYIEPSTKSGFEYLETLREWLREKH
jgi:hypothetical protein